MEIPLSLQRPLSCRTLSSDQRTQFKIKPFIGFSPNGNPQSFSLKMHHAAANVTYRITASAAFSRRRRQREISKSRSKDSRGSTARTQVPKSSRRRDQRNNEKKQGKGTSPTKEFRGSNMKELERKAEHDVEEESDDKSNGIGLEIGSMSESLFDDKTSQSEKNGQFFEVDEQGMESKAAERITKNEVGGSNMKELERKAEHDMEEESDDKSNGIGLEIGSTSESLFDDKMSQFEKNGQFFEVDEQGVESKAAERITKNGVYVPLDAVKYEEPGWSENINGGKLQKVTADGDVDVSVYGSRKEILDKLAEDNFMEGNKLFCYPELVKPDQNIEIFFNRSLSTLKNAQDVIIMGAFNDWEWKSFAVTLNKSYTRWDWWSCHIHVPKEAYKIDFVFYNGKDLYDNNNMQDFCINVWGGMDASDFENFLLEEKRKEEEELMRQKAEMERRAEEQRLIEAERAASEADRARAREETAERRGMLQELMKKAVASVHNVWYIEPSEFEGNGIIRLYYNRSFGPLIHANDIWIHGGHNGWKGGLSIISKLSKSEDKGGDWWYADVVIPDEALVVDWVFANGPPEQANIYDNNKSQDFHAIVPNSMPDELYWAEYEQKIYRGLQTARRLREEAKLAKAEKTAQMKAETKERTLKTFLLSQKHIVYTDPLNVQAGSAVTLFYNPANTVLDGKPEVWLRCSFNQWSHHFGKLPPQKMIPAENGSHLKATVKVPLDTYVMDFVFSEREDGGVFDDRNGVEYHIPVFGGVGKEPSMHIVHVAVEMAPIAKVGGLGDVVTGLSRAVQDMNHNVDIILPKYDCINLSNVRDLQFHKSYSWGGTEIKVWSGKVEGLNVYFLEPQNGLFWGGCIYGHGNDRDRFGFFSHAALEFLVQSGLDPDIIHCHDWCSAPVSWLFKEHYMHHGLSKARVVFTIHNLEFGADLIGKAMAFSDKVTTVSSTYSQEVSGNPIIAPHGSKFHGILNGINPNIWDPYNDEFIPVSYTSENVVEGKRAAKEALQQRLGLERADLPLVGIITRLTHQKGIDLIKHAIWHTLECNGQVVLLGTAPDPRIQNDFVNLANQLHSSHNDRARLCLTYDEPLSHLIYGGSDFILVPSIFEPCGLTQLTAMRYGSIPVVRKTGGLYDTVFDVDHDEERAKALGIETNGFNFNGADAGGVDDGLNRAISAWYDEREWFNLLCKRVMDQDWSWNRPALDYLELYRAARK